MVWGRGGGVGEVRVEGWNVGGRGRGGVTGGEGLARGGKRIRYLIVSDAAALDGGGERGGEEGVGRRVLESTARRTPDRRTHGTEHHHLLALRETHRCVAAPPVVSQLGRVNKRLPYSSHRYVTEN